RAADPAQPGALIVANPKELIFETTIDRSGSQSQSKIVVVSNDGTEPLVVSETVIAGEFADQFDAVSPSGSQIIEPGASLEFTVTYAPDLNRTNIGYQSAALTLNTNDEKTPSFEVGLYALKKTGFEGSNEPPLQDVVDALGIGLDIGWTSLANTTDPAPIADEIETERWVKLNADTPVRITPVARYSPAEALPFGWYTNDGEVFTQEIGVLKDGLTNAQTLYPPMESEESFTTFDPHSAVFGFYVESKTFNRTNYTEDVLNDGSGVDHRARIYPNKDRQGNIIANSYLITFEDAENGDYQDYMFIIDNVVPFNEAVLAFGFNKESLQFNTSINDNISASQDITLSVSGPIRADEVRLDATEDWIVLPESFDFETPFDIAINAEGLPVGNYEAIVTASSDNYASASLTVKLIVTDEVNYVYQFNFQTPDDIAISPEGYIDDLGAAFAAQNTDLGTISYGWVLPNTDTPASASVNGRNRNTGTNDDALLKTFTIIGHRTAATYPLRDWKVDLPNGSYFVNISVGENEFRDSNHVLDVNGITVVDFDQENNNPNNLIYSEGTRLVEVTDGTLRLSLNPRGVNAKANYIRIAPINTALLPPAITATLDGLLFDEERYRGAVEVTLAAEDRSGSGSIARLEYVLDDAEALAYTEPFTVSTAGEHTLVVEAEDANGNIAAKTLTFNIEEPSGAILYMENMTKIPGTQRGFPADDYFTFYRIGNPNTGGDAPNTALTHDANIMRLNNTGTGTLLISDIQISDTRDYTYTVLNNIGEVSFPISIAPGSSRDIQLRITASTTNGRSALFKESITIVSNADNGGESIATLHGGFTPQPEGGDEITAQEVFDVFGFSSTMRSIVNDNGTISPPNGEPTRPSSNYPDAENIDAGYEGDLILSSNFVQADKSKPVYGVQLSALHGKGGDSGRFVQVNGTGTVASIDFRHATSYYQTLLPKNTSNVINSDRATTISGSFRIAVANYLSSGGNDIRGTRPDLLGLRIYKAKDRNGNIIPNEYIVLQDFIQGGCGAGSANCDWNDNTFYFINVRPEAEPSALPIEDQFADSGTSFDSDLSGYFEKGYPGNKLSFSATLLDGQELPAWMEIDEAGNFVGDVPQGAEPIYSIRVTATDLNGLKVDSPFDLIVTDPNALELRINAGGPTVEYNNNQFVKDIYFDGGLPYVNNQAPLPELHSSERSEAKTFSYAVPVKDGNYAVTLHFAEIYWGAVGGGPGGVGRRIFDVNLEDELVLDNYDINADVGPQTPVAKTFLVTVDDGFINLNLSSEASVGGKDFPMLSGLEIIDENQVNIAPAAIASADQTEGKVEHTVNFTGSSSSDDDSIVSYVWNFGNGDSSTEINPQYTYDVSGNYEVTLTVTDNEGLTNTSEVLLITVLPANTAPIAVAEADITSGSAPLTVQFTGSNSQYDSEVVNYFWNFGNGETSSDANPNYTFSQEGNYTVVLVVEDEEGQFGVGTITITVGLDNAAPVAVIEGGPFTGNTPLDVFFIGDNSTDDKGISSYVWDFGDGSFSNLSNPTHRYNTPGSYLVSLTVFDAEGFQDTAQRSVQVNSVGGGALAPVAVADANITQGVSPLQVNFDGTSSNDDTGIIASYRWTLNNVEISNVATFDYTFTEEGNFNVLLTVTDEDGLTDTDAVEITVDAANTAPIAVAESDISSGDAPLTVNFTGTGSSDDKGVAAYSWTIGGEEVSTLAIFEYTFTQPGVYEVILQVTDDEGLSANDTLNITVQEANEGDDFALRINAGGPEVVYNGQVFASDRNFVGGREFANEAATVSTLFKTERSSLTQVFDYAIPVPDGTYNVNLYFAEIYWGANGGGAGGNRKRVFDVILNGDLILNNYDINADVGPQTEVVKTYEVTVTNGQLNINFSALSNVGGINQPKLSGIEVLAINDPVNEAPQAIATATPLSGSAPLEVSFTGSNSTDDKQVVSYLWTFRDGETSTAQNPTHTFTQSGDFDVTLQVSDAEGLTSTATVTISVAGVNQPPVAIADAAPRRGPAPLPVNFTGSNSSDDSNIVSYSWIFGDGSTSTAANPEHTYTAPGTYLANLTVTDENGQTDTTPNIEIVVEEIQENDDVAIYLNTGSSVDVNYEGREFIGDLSLTGLY
ncbi:MAG: PKD domain-containing protein, partial [Leeuwenhoekiella sp.]